MPFMPSDPSAGNESRNASRNPYRSSPAAPRPSTELYPGAVRRYSAQLAPRFSQQASVTYKKANAVAEDVRSAFGPTVNYGDMERFQAFTPGRNRGPKDSACAPVKKRIGAQVLDVAMFCGLYLVALLAVALGVDASAAALSGENVAAFGALAAPGAYYIWQTLWDSTGGSLGKRALGLRVVAPADSPVSPGAAAKRNLWLLLNYIPLAGTVAAIGVGSWLAGSARMDAFGMAAHDRHARLRVIDKAVGCSGEKVASIRDNREMNGADTPAMLGHARHNDADDAR